MTESSRFPGFNKITRLNREVIWTEKIDGTNGLIDIQEHPLGTGVDMSDEAQLASGITVVVPPNQTVSEADGLPEIELWITAGSRNRWLTRGDDNYKFAQWVHDNAMDLGYILGPGRHYGEWWGQGVQRKYNMDHKRFSLFNTWRWEHLKDDEVAARINLDVVPVLARTNGFEQELPLKMLYMWGSFASPGFQKPEGVVGFHVASNQSYKVLIENDSISKGEAVAKDQALKVAA